MLVLSGSAMARMELPNPKGPLHDRKVVFDSEVDMFFG